MSCQQGKVPLSFLWVPQGSSGFLWVLQGSSGIFVVLLGSSVPAAGSVEVPVLDAVGQVANQRLQRPADVSGLHLLQQHAAVWLPGKTHRNQTASPAERQKVRRL